MLGRRTVSFKPRRAASRRRTANLPGWGGGVFEHPSSTPGPCSDTSQTVTERASKIMTKVLRSSFRSGQVRSPEVSKGQILLFSTFSTNRLITREPEELERRKTACSIALVTLVRQCALRLDLRSTVWSPESKH